MFTTSEGKSLGNLQVFVAYNALPCCPTIFQLLYPSHGTSMICAGGRFHRDLGLMGGCSWLKDANDEVYGYDAASNHWSKAAPMPTARYSFNFCSLFVLHMWPSIQVTMGDPLMR